MIIPIIAEKQRNVKFCKPLDTHRELKYNTHFNTRKALTMNANTVASTIIAGNFTNDELVSIIEAVKYARSRLQKQTIRSLMLGDNVNFTSTKTGRNTTGTVYKIAQKYVTVRTIDGLWKVPANMLNLIED